MSCRTERRASRGVVTWWFEVVIGRQFAMTSPTERYYLECRGTRERRAIPLEGNEVSLMSVVHVLNNISAAVITDSCTSRLYNTS